MDKKKKKVEKKDNKSKWARLTKEELSAHLYYLYIHSVPCAMYLLLYYLKYKE